MMKNLQSRGSYADSGVGAGGGGGVSGGGGGGAAAAAGNGIYPPLQSLRFGR